MHIIPRLRSDFGGDPDNVYPALEASERDLESDLVQHSHVADEGSTAAAASALETAVEAARRRRENGWQVPKDTERRARTEEEMEAEAKWLASLLAAA